MRTGAESLRRGFIRVNGIVQETLMMVVWQSLWQVLSARVSAKPRWKFGIWALRLLGTHLAHFRHDGLGKRHRSARGCSE